MNRPPSHRPLLVLLSLSALSFGLAGCSSNRYIEKEPVNVAVEHLLQSIDQAIDIAHAHHVKDEMRLEITNVSVLLETIVDKDSTQDLSVSVLEIEAGEDEVLTQALTLTLQPPKKKDGTEATPPASAHPSMVRELVKGIDAAFLAARGARKGLARLHPDGIPLEVKTISAATSFAITTTGGGVPSISLFGVSLTAQRSKERLHTVTLTFEAKD